MADTLHADMAAAAQVQQLLENEHVKNAFAAYEAALIEGWKTTAARDVEGRERIWLAIQGAGKIQSHLQAIVTNGRLAEHQIERDFHTPKKRWGVV